MARFLKKCTGIRCREAVMEIRTPDGEGEVNLDDLGEITRRFTILEMLDLYSILARSGEFFTCPKCGHSQKPDDGRQYMVARLLFGNNVNLERAVTRLTAAYPDD